MKNVILIGMPGCGKSTVGVLLAKEIGYGFIDSDLLIQAEEKRLLSQIIEEEGIDGFNAIEDRVNASIDADRCVVATGGSVIYGENAMRHLKEIGKVVYIKLPFEEIARRLGDLKSRGVSIKEGYTLKQLYDERIPLYERYADVIVDCENISVEECLSRLCEAIKDIRGDI